MDRQTGIGMKDRYLMLIFEIVLLESSEVETNYLVTDGRKIVQTDGQKIVQADGNNSLNISIWGDTSPTKKEFLKLGSKNGNTTSGPFSFPPFFKMQFWSGYGETT